MYSAIGHVRYESGDSFDQLVVATEDNHRQDRGAVRQPITVALKVMNSRRRMYGPQT
jgi:hypothetical protein